ncbi:MAG: MarR family transcriptional regulator [Deltaproteobacteria bacterium]
MKNTNGSAWDPASTPTFWINHASRALLRSFEDQLRPLGFGMAYLPVAIALEENGPLQQKDLLEHAHVEQPTMAALLSRMERDGLITRTAAPDDGRARLIALTPRAKANLSKGKQAMRGVFDRALAGVSERKRSALITTLRTVVNNLGAASASARRQR